jgi:hypothetical protein
MNSNGPLVGNYAAICRQSTALALVISFVLLLAIAFDVRRVAQIPATRPIGRFEIIAPGSNFAVDTRDGRMCLLYDPIGSGSQNIPLCKDLL